MVHDLKGVIVSEEEVAKDLGFKDVHDFRRWTTDLGHKVLELEAEVREVKGDRERFKRTGMRLMKVLEMIEPLLVELQDKKTPEEELVKEMLFALRVVVGKEVDWGNKLKF